MRGLARGTLAAVAAAASVAMSAGGAQADVIGGTRPGGYYVTASVQLSGDVRGGSGVRTMSVPATCWWAPVQAAGLSDPSDPAAVKEWWETTMPTINGTFAPARIMYGEAAMYDAAIAAAASGQELTFYGATCVDAKDLLEFNNGTHGAPEGWELDGETNLLPITYGFFPPGQEPEPVVDPADLADIAWDAIDLVNPVLDRNPKVGGAVAATLVGLPTWFWVVDPEAVGGADGTRTATAAVGDAWATVTATNDGVRISSGAGGAQCSAAQARVRYAPGVAEAGACTVQFGKASVGRPGGWPVTAVVTWGATWVGSDGPGGDTLDDVPVDDVVLVPVAESQAVVGQVG